MTTQPSSNSNSLLAIVGTTGGVLAGASIVVISIIALVAVLLVRRRRRGKNGGDNATGTGKGGNVCLCLYSLDKKIHPRTYAVTLMYFVLKNIMTISCNILEY